MNQTRLTLFLLSVVLLTGCATPVAVRSLSAELLTTQRAYSVSLHAYFAAVEKFADAQVKIADNRIDEITAQINREYATRANTNLAAAVNPEQRQRIIDQLVNDVAATSGADLPLKRKIVDSVTTLKQKDQELEAAYHVILTATEKLDEYTRLKKADEAAINALVQAVGANNQKILSIVDAITGLTQDLSQILPKAHS